MRRLQAALFGVAFAASCARDPLPPPGHVLLFFDTDAPVPPAAGERAAPADAAPLFDRLVVEVYEPGQSSPCSGCRRDFALDRGILSELRASIQVPTAPGVAGYRVRARLFLAAHVVSGTEPPAESTVEVVASLPIAPEEGGLEETIVLAVDDVGKPRGTMAEPIATTAGRPPASKVGSWSGAARIDCPEAARRGEVCVPGGAFWMGRPGDIAAAAQNVADRARIVVVAPHYLDVNEATLADVRAYVASAPDLASGSAKDDPACSYTEELGLHEAFPANCMTWVTSRHVCLSKHKDLPTEAQFEHVAGALMSRRFVWGDDPPACSDAVWGRGGSGALAQVLAPCRGTVTGPLCIGPSCIASRARDHLVLQDGTINDLAGNVEELVLDRFNEQGEACWSAPGVRRDPICTLPGRTGSIDLTVRGGSFISTGKEMTASSRTNIGILSQFSSTGLRCARPTSLDACGPLEPGLYMGSTKGGDEGTIDAFGIGCSGIVSMLGSNAKFLPFYGVGTIDAASHIAVDAITIDPKATRLRFVGEVKDARHAAGTWSAGDKVGTWNIGPR